MIASYYIHNFKNHKDTSLSFSHLNIFTGLNGMGKSSVIQSLLLLRDSYFKDPSLSTLYLNTDSVDVGYSSDLVNCNIEKGQDQEILRLELVDRQQKLNFAYRYIVGDEDILQAADGAGLVNQEVMKQCPLFTDYFQYLSAFRSGPQQIYSSSSIVERHRQVSQKMGMGEYAVYFLHKFQNEDIPITDLMYPGSSSRSLYDQTELWMTEISKGIKFQLNQIGKNVELSFGYERTGRPTVYHSAMNTGYGVSYILSVIVSVLSAKPGSLIIIENPESHIHPSGQAALMHMIAIAAKRGVQFIIETHSDHIVNGALVNSKKGVIDKEDIRIYFFDVDENLNATSALLKIEECGRIQEAPSGFFDQMDADTEVLFDLV